jgi:CheY-like chemotaxis protein
MHMPKMDGFDLVQRIKQQPRRSTATIVMLTSGDHRGDATRCVELGLAAYLLKPIRQSELREAIARLFTTCPQSAAAPIVTRASLVSERNPGSGMKILLAEDNPVNQKLATRLLEKRGHCVVVAANGKEALTALDATSYDLVLMDVQMPEMDGIEATTELRRRETINGRHQLVFAMTALAMKGDRERCIHAGMDGYLTKPIRQQQLDRILESCELHQRGPKIVSMHFNDSDNPVNVGELLQRIGADQSFLAELVEIFRNDYPRQLKLVREALVRQDSPGVEKACHALKGAVSNLAATRASEITRGLEIAARSGNLAHTDSTLHQLETELSRVVAQLERMLQSVPA